MAVEVEQIVAQEILERDLLCRIRGSSSRTMDSCRNLENFLVGRRDIVLGEGVLCLWISRLLNKSGGRGIDDVIEVQRSSLLFSMSSAWSEEAIDDRMGVDR